MVKTRGNNKVSQRSSSGNMVMVVNQNPEALNHNSDSLHTVWHTETSIALRTNEEVLKTQVKEEAMRFSIFVVYVLYLFGGFLLMFDLVFFFAC